MIDAARKVKTALLSYQISKGKDINAGYDVMRYAKAGYLKINIDATAEFMDWFPKELAYVILRLVLRGVVTYQPTIEDQLKEV